MIGFMYSNTRRRRLEVRPPRPDRELPPTEQRGISQESFWTRAERAEFTARCWREYETRMQHSQIAKQLKVVWGSDSEGRGRQAGRLSDLLD